MSEFILVEHKAIKRGLHWDLRFEIPNSDNWASFAFSKFPPTNPGERIYIPRTNNHSREEALFVGKIKEGEYGAGTLRKIDGGKCEVLKFSNAHIVVNFKGNKIKGLYHFINMGVIRHNYKSKVYTFFKAKNQDLSNT
jgi:bifunctional non-homologous end joining protein LigD